MVIVIKYSMRDVTCIRIGMFVMLAMAMSTLSVVTTIFVLYFFYKNWTRPLPRWLQRFAFDFLARIMCMEVTAAGDDLQRATVKQHQRHLQAQLTLIMLIFISGPVARTPLKFK